MKHAERVHNIRRLPDFLVIGAQKSGTKSIYHVLKQYPMVYMASRREVCFFDIDYNYRKGLSYYSSFFEKAGDKDVIGEVSPGYLYAEVAPKRIAECLPEVKLIASLRNPVDRAFSAYRMRVAKGSETRSFIEAILSDPTYVNHGRYYQQLSRYFDHFSKEQFCILLFDELKMDPVQFYRNILQFIDVDFSVMPDLRKHNVAGEPKYSIVTHLLNIAYRSRNAVRESRFQWLVDNRLVDSYSRKIRNRIAAWNQRVASTPSMDEEAMAYLNNELHEDIERLSDLIKRDLSHWRSD